FEDRKKWKELGKGGFGVVYAVHGAKGGLFDGQKVAIKAAKNPRKKLLEREVDNFKSLQHENIVEFKGYFNENGVDYIVMELCKEGSIYRYKDEFDPEEVVPILRQLVNALEYLHSKGICQRDLTSGNVLISRIREIEVMFQKLCDFGLSKVMQEGRAHHTMAGTPGYMAPEVMEGGVYSKEVDIYSLGCLL
ncbi:hypothetical protein PMAYCL1PPCAC_11700, partial [Pristionchus mayeri]